ncbi:MAG TPA: biotin/lipoyl-binding protein, partial [Thermodesulfobacteriaceae bacterium]|nr:biotin/lipoyl-binding protein [Thermodesulfobacteriaceae bacterium]
SHPFRGYFPGPCQQPGNPSQGTRGRAAEAARFSSRITGYLLEVRKYEGDPVKKGEVLARIDDRKIRAQMGALSAQISAAETEFFTRKHIYERDRTLFENQAISR